MTTDNAFHGTTVNGVLHSKLVTITLKCIKVEYLNDASDFVTIAA